MVAALICAAVSDIVVARQLIRPQALVWWAGVAQSNTGPFTAIGSKEDHVLPLKDGLKGCHRGLDAPVSRSASARVMASTGKPANSASSD
jgi:hypothetical protein